MHAAPDPQTVPHVPQAAASVCRFAHRPPHTTWPAGHMQTPAVHSEPPGHARPQAPQLAGSVLKFEHTPLQSVSPAAHATQAPPTHC